MSNTCFGQVSSDVSTGRAPSSKPDPVVTGTPPPTVDPLNHSGLVSQYIRTIFQDSQRNYWFGPAGESVARYDERTLRYYSKSEFFRGNTDALNVPWNSVHAIAEDKQGNIWFGTHHGTIKYDGTSFRSYDKQHGLNNSRIGRKGILVDRTGSVWIGTEKGVYRYLPSADSSGGVCFSLFQKLAPVMISDMMEDREGNIWFATQENGIFRFDGREVRNISDEAGMGDNYAGGMLQDRSGNYWFTMKGGICRYDGTAFTRLTVKDGLGGSEVWGIIEDASGILWITARGSTTRYDPSVGFTNPKAFTVFTEKDGINCCVQSMYKDRSGIMWWGAGAGLYRFDGKRFYQVKQNGPW